MPRGETEHRVLAPYLVELIERNSYFRQPNVERRQIEKAAYKKGWELRLVLNNEDEVALADQLIRQSGLRPGRPFGKWGRWVIPMYGRRMVEVVQANVDLRKQGTRKKRA